MQHYDEVEEMLHKAILVEQQVKRKGPSRPSYEADSNRPSYQRDNKQVTTPKFNYKPFTVNQDKDKGKAPSTSSRAWDLKCF